MNFFLKTFFCILILLFTILAGIVIGISISDQDGVPGGDGLAVIKIEGIIINSEPYLKSIRKIRKSDSVKAVVVRINSPGGSVATSQEIYEELKSLGEDIPVIASMGSVAASGGYYIACAASEIYANPGTVTGSIGVIAQFANYEQLLKWARVEFEVIKTGEFKDAGSPLRKMSKEQREYLQELVDGVLVQFKDTVAERRNMNSKKVDSLSDGKIFAGSQAKKLGLIDHIGTFEVAIAEARKLGDLDKDSWIIEYPIKKKTLFDHLLPETLSGRTIISTPLKTGFGLFYVADVVY